MRTIKKLSRSTGQWKLPQPLDEKEEDKWVKLPRVANTIPFGYYVDENKPKILIPIPTELDALEQAKKYLKQYSAREVANWLSTRTGRSISHTGLLKRVNNGRKRQNKASSYRTWAEYAKKALKIANALEKERLDAREN